MQTNTIFQRRRGKKKISLIEFRNSVRKKRTESRIRGLALATIIFASLSILILSVVSVVLLFELLAIGFEPLSVVYFLVLCVSLIFGIYTLIAAVKLRKLKRSGYNSLKFLSLFFLIVGVVDFGLMALNHQAPTGVFSVVFYGIVFLYLDEKKIKSYFAKK